MPDGSIYGEDVARFYDLLIYGRPEAEAERAELDFLLQAIGEACRRPAPEVLDVGCGTGRHLIPLARAGCRVTGLDNSQAMLDECRRRLRRHDLTAQLLAMDMEALDREAAFDAALAMDSVLNYLIETERIRAQLARLRRALRPGGLLVVDGWNFFAQWERYGVPYGEVREGGGVRIDYRDRHWLDDFAALYHIELDATVHEAGHTHAIHAHEVLRAMTVGEMTAYIEGAGFADVRAYPDFDPALWSEACGERMIFLARRPGAGGAD